MRISNEVRHYIVDGLLVIGQMTGEGSYKSFFSRVYPACREIDYNHTKLINEIARHCDYNPDDWGDDASILEYLGIYDKWTDEQFLHFCQEYVNPVFVRTIFNMDEERLEDLQPRCVDAINNYLLSCGYELREKSRIYDKVTYEIVETEGVKGNIQGIIFAAIYKPDVLLDDVLNHKVRIPRDDEKYLYYDQPIGNSPITWNKICSWYDKEHALGFDFSFEERLRKAVNHCGSPIEEFFFDAYLELKSEIGDNIPALLPQVWLYYDEKAQKERIEKIFEHQCMDFMMLFSNSKRIVIELDGAQHYSDDESIPGRDYPVKVASTQKYAAMVSAQRDMTLAGYEVYRFGGSEFAGEDRGKEIVKQFLKDLFEKHSA